MSELKSDIVMSSPHTRPVAAMSQPVYPQSWQVVCLFCACVLCLHACSAADQVTGLCGIWQVPAMQPFMAIPSATPMISMPLQMHPSPGQSYACEYACGYISPSYQSVAQHEQMCSRALQLTEQPTNINTHMAIEMTMQLTQAPSGRSSAPPFFCHYTSTC